VIECELWREYEGGDHAIMVGSVKNLMHVEDDQHSHQNHR